MFITSMVCKCLLKLVNTWQWYWMLLRPTLTLNFVEWCRCKAGADSFADGMNDVLKMYDVVRSNAMAYMPLFVCNAAELTRAQIKTLCVVERSPSGSNDATAEDDTIYCWDCFLLNVEGWYGQWSCHSFSFQICILFGFLRHLRSVCRLNVLLQWSHGLVWSK